MPWKYCPACKGLSYSADTHYKSWICPYCGKELKDEPDYNSPKDVPKDKDCQVLELQ